MARKAMLPMWACCLISLMFCLVALPCMSRATYGESGDSASGGVSYVEWTWDEETQELSSETKVAESPTLVTTDSRTLNAGWYVVEGTVVISGCVNTQGDVHLILTDGSSLTIDEGISLGVVPSMEAGSSNLSIYGQEEGTGRLIAGGGNRTNLSGIGPDVSS